MKRILFVLHDSSVSGSSYCFSNLLKTIDRMRFEPIVAVPKEGPLCEEIQKMGVRVEYISSITTYPYNQSLLKYKSIKSLIRIYKSFLEFNSILRKVKPDIVYLNTMMLFPYLKLSKQQGSKTVIHIREHWPIDKHSFQLCRIRKFVYEYADKIVAINHYSASMFPDKSVTIIYDWVDMETRRNGPAIYDIIRDARPLKVYLYTGGVRSEKGLEEIIKTFSKHIVGDDKRLLVLGVNPNISWNGFKGKIKKMLSRFGYKTYLERIITLCDKDNRVICHPAVFNITNIMEKAYGYVSFFTIPHANLALAESIILRVPSIAALTEESLEYSDEGQLAQLYEINNMESFKDAWIELDNDATTLREKLNSNSIKIAEMFNPKRNSEVFGKLLNSL